MPDSRDDVADLFVLVARDLRRTQAAALQPFGVTPSVGRALRVLHREAPMRPGDLAERLRIAPRTATDVVDALAGAGLVTRAPDEHDRRATLLSLTDRGVELAHSLAQARREAAGDYFAGLTSQDRQHLARILGTLNRVQR